MELTELQGIINRHGKNLKQEVGLALSEQEAKDIIKYAVSEVFSLHVVGSSCLWIVQDKENNILYTSFEKQKAIDKRIELIEEHKITLDVNKLLVG